MLVELTAEVCRLGYLAEDTLFSSYKNWKTSENKGDLMSWLAQVGKVGETVWADVEIYDLGAMCVDVALSLYPNHTAPVYVNVHHTHAAKFRLRSPVLNPLAANVT
jgi:hypothetical protein